MLEAGLGEPLLRLQLREPWEATEGSSPSSYTLNNGVELWVGGDIYHDSKHTHTILPITRSKNYHINLKISFQAP